MINNIFISLRGGGHYLPRGFWSSSFLSCHFKVSCVTLSAFSHAASSQRKQANRWYCNHLLSVNRPDDAYPRLDDSSPPTFEVNLDAVDLILLHPLPRHRFRVFLTFLPSCPTVSFPRSPPGGSTQTTHCPWMDSYKESLMIGAVLVWLFALFKVL